jgi:predicted RNase H-like HicB family nuclease
MEFVLIIHAAEEGGYWAEVPSLDGCFVQGETIDEVLHDAPAAIAAHLEALESFGERPSHRETIFVATVRAEPAA